MRVLYLLILILLITPVSAERIEIHQGDYIYQNETVDISLAGSWPDYKVAWCASNNPECDPPELVVQFKGNLHTYWMDPAIFTHYGDYYRWDGEWHRGENALAFRYQPGERPVYLNLTKNETENETPPPVQIGPFRWILARGDNPSFTIITNRTDPCHLWVWSDSDALYGLSMNNVNSTYFVNLSSAQTLGLKVGTYRAYLQFDGRNGIQDIYYHDLYLQSPYNNRIAPPVPLTYWGLGNTRMQFDEYALSIVYYDDVIIPVEVVVGDPEITITSVVQEENKLYISGATNWKENTSIILKLDPENYPLDNDAKFHTWQTYASGTMDSYRTFETAVQISPDDLSIGPHHIDMQKYGDIYSPISSYDFKRTDVYVMPIPTPKQVAVFVDPDYLPIPTRQVATVNTTQIKTVKPTTVPVTTNSTPIVPGLTPGPIPNDMTGVTPEQTFPAEATILSVNATASPTPTHDQNIHVPIPAWVPILAILFVVIRRKP
jgi:hypothetical protein